MLALPVAFEDSALPPVATFLLPVVLTVSALRPVATLSSPVEVLASAKTPVATLLTPFLFTINAPLPMATFSSPVVFENRALRPVATLSVPRRVGTQRAAAGRHVAAAGGVGEQRVLATATLQQPVVRFSITVRPNPTLVASASIRARPRAVGW
jgi:hypothetical protein